MRLKKWYFLLNLVKYRVLVLKFPKTRQKTRRPIKPNAKMIVVGKGNEKRRVRRWQSPRAALVISACGVGHFRRRRLETSHARDGKHTGYVRISDKVEAKILTCSCWGFVANSIHFIEKSYSIPAVILTCEKKRNVKIFPLAFICDLWAEWG